MALFGNDQRNVLVVLIISLHSGKENISNQTKSRRKSLQFCCHSKKNCKSRTSLSQSTKEIFNLAGFIVDSVQLSLERTERPLIVSRPEQYQEPQVEHFITQQDVCRPLIRRYTTITFDSPSYIHSASKGSHSRNFTLFFSILKPSLN